MEALGAGKRPAVTITINGYTYRSSIAVLGGAHMVAGQRRQPDRCRRGRWDEVDVDIELDTAPREVSLPPDFAAALDAEPAARRRFEGLSYSNKSWQVLSINGAKAEGSARDGLPNRSRR